jgi:hypothetical protein
MYYPKSQITVNLYTNGNEFTDNNTKQPYQGFYFKTSSGQYYTGKSPQNPPNVKLNPIRTNFEKDAIIGLDLNTGFSRETGIDTFPQKRLNGNIPANSIIIDSVPEYNYPSAASAPVSAITFPTDNDYTIGEFQRYFLKKRNEIQYLEVNIETYLNYSNQVNGVQWQLYLPITIPWELTGDYDSVYNTNRNIVLLKESTLRIVGFANYFRNQFTKYFRFAPGENLYTAGNELKNARTNMNYIGYYHISSTGKTIAGKRATADMQDALIPITENLEVGTSRRKNIAYNHDSLKKDDKRFGY